MQDYGLVSIITPAWGCARFIGRTISSIQAQTYQNWELLIQDDCSVDDTKAIVEDFAGQDARIKYVCNSENFGAAITRNKALKRANGRWIAFLDADDVWLPEKLEHQLKFMTDNGYAFTYHDYTEMTEDGDDIGTYVSGIKKVNKWQMYTCCWPGCLSVMYDKDRIGLIQINDVKRQNDLALWCKVVQKSPCYLLQENLAKYRKRKGSITADTVMGKISATYTFFRMAIMMGRVNSALFTLLNIFGHIYKKKFFVKHLS